MPKTNFLQKETAYNYIINGNMIISQRGSFTSASAATNNIYYLDRWKSNVTTVTANKQHITTNQPSQLSGSKSLKYIATSSATGVTGAIQFIEYPYLFAGKTVTVSGYIKSNNVNARLMVFDGAWNSTDGHAGDGEWEYFEKTFEVDSAVSTLGVAAFIRGADGSSVSISSSDYIEFTGIQFEINNQATEFSPRSFDEEMILCQRYYSIQDAIFFDDVTSTAEYYGVGVTYPVPMRTTPTLSATFSTGFRFSETSLQTFAFQNDRSAVCRAKPDSTGAGSRYIYNVTAEAEL